MKVLLIGFTKITYMPYINFHIKELQKSKCDISLIYWDRDTKPEIELESTIKRYCFRKNMLDSEPLFKKVPNFIRFRNYAKKIILDSKFDLIIVLHSTPGVLLSDLLMMKYRNRYILDYRDFTYENIGFYKKIVSGLVKNSLLTFVSSDAFRKNIPNDSKIYTTHNVLMDSINNRNVRKKSIRKREIIRIRYWGLIRHEAFNKALINAIAHDKRFELHYHGREQETAVNLKFFCYENRIENVYFHGEYKPKDRYIFAADTDLIHNAFENDLTMKPAMSNKFYDGLIFYIPQLCNIDSYMGDEILKNNLGISISPFAQNFTNLVYDYYKTIDWGDFELNCDEKLKEILEEYNKASSALQRFLNEKKV